MKTCVFNFTQKTMFYIFVFSRSLMHIQIELWMSLWWIIRTPKISLKRVIHCRTNWLQEKHKQMALGIFPCTWSYHYKKLSSFEINRKIIVVKILQFVLNHKEKDSYPCHEFHIQLNLRIQLWILPFNTSLNLTIQAICLDGYSYSWMANINNFLLFWLMFKI